MTAVATTKKSPEGLPFSFPLSLDHLIPLIEYNVYRATLTNISIMSLFSLLYHPNCPVGHHTPPPLFPHQSGAACIPPSLVPTPLQQTTPHENWIDILPSPGMRDNAIRATREGRLSNDRLCEDLLGGLCASLKKWEKEKEGEGEGEGASEKLDARLIVWKDPWEATGWEATQGFVTKYGYLLNGCEDIRRATNRWREMRGDDPIVWEVE